MSFCGQALDDIDLNFKSVTSGQSDYSYSAEEATVGVRRPQRSSAYSLLKLVTSYTTSVRSS